MTKSGISAAILAGGDSMRFGGITKPNIVIEGIPIIIRILTTIREMFPEIILVTNKPEEFNQYRDIKVTEDIIPGAGPIGGVHAALSVSSNEAVFVFAGDMPFLDKKIIISQRDAFSKGNMDILVPRTGNLVEPLHAVYRKRILDSLEYFITEKHKRSIRDYIAESETGYFDLPETESVRHAFTNINSPSDLEKYNLKNL
ncbi:MAG: molybdenum cofactor guanylyltransferase [Bacteroidota bacterium]